MKQTKKYMGAKDILTYPYETQEQLYQELNRLGWFWESKNQQWIRDDSLPAKEASNLIKIRVWTSNDKIENVGELIAEAIQKLGFKLEEKSQAYICRPPNNNESRVYLTFSLDD